MQQTMSKSVGDAPVSRGPVVTPCPPMAGNTGNLYADVSALEMRIIHAHGMAIGQRQVIDNREISSAAISIDYNLVGDDLKCVIGLVESNRGIAYTIRNSTAYSVLLAREIDAMNARLRPLLNTMYWLSNYQACDDCGQISVCKERHRPAVTKWLCDDCQNGATRPADTRRIERGRMTKGLRYDILKRDNFTCRQCGATAADGVKLHVDHIVPIAAGGKTEPSNLQTLCAPCNAGKAAKF